MLSFLIRVLFESEPSLLFIVLDVSLLHFREVYQVERHEAIQVSDVGFKLIIFLDKFLDAFNSSILRCNVQGGVSSAPTEIVVKQDSDSGRQFVVDLHEMPILFILCCQCSVFTELIIELFNHFIGIIDSHLISHHL